MDHKLVDVCSRKRVAAAASPDSTALTSDLSDWRLEDAGDCMSGDRVLWARGLSRMASKAAGAAPLCTDRMRDHMIPAPTNSRTLQRITLNRSNGCADLVPLRRQLFRQSGDIMNRTCRMNYDSEFCHAPRISLPKRAALAAKSNGTV